MILSDKQNEVILKEWGEIRYNEAIRCINIYREKWQLEELNLIEKPAQSVVLTCTSPKYGLCVLKIRFDDLFKRETEVLRVFNGRGYCRLYEYSLEDKTLLIERILPADDLWDKPTRDERAVFFCDLYNEWYSAPIETINLSILPTLLSRFEDNKYADIRKYYGEFIYPHIERAKEIIFSVNLDCPDTICHGDLAFNNIIKNQNGRYIAIDPMGIVCAPMFNISEFILGQFCTALFDEPIENLLNFIDLIANKTGVSVDIIKKCLYVETVLWLNMVNYKNWGVNNILAAEKIMEHL